MSNQLPLVSVIIPSYNHAQYIENCISSILNQDYTNFELIVIDDGSTDGSIEILIALQKKYGFYLETNKNQGLAKTLNRGFRDLAKGEFLSACASDDYWCPDKLKMQVSFFQKNLDCGMVYGKAYIIDENNAILEERTDKTNIKLKGGQIFKELILMEFHPPVNYMYRKSILQELGYFKEDIWAEDFDMNLRIARNYSIGFINHFLSYYRVNNTIPSKNLNFKSINSHKLSIEVHKDSEFYLEAIKLWYYRCFTWYAPFSGGKKIAIKGMFYNLDRLLTKDFIHAMGLLIFRWHKK